MERPRSAPGDAAPLPDHQGEASGWFAPAVRALLAAYGRTPRELAVAALPGGLENLNLLVEADAERLVLRRYDATPPEELPWELALLRFLTSQGFPTAPLIERLDGGLAGTLDGRPAALFGFVPGRHPAWNLPGAADMAAGAIVRLHEVTRDLRLPSPRSRMDSRRRVERFRAWARGGSQGPDMAALALLTEQVEHYAAEFAARLAPLAHCLPAGVVHHDPHVGNLLCDEAGRLVALLDFDDAHATYLVADVAVLIAVWGTDQDTGRFAPPWASGVLQAYARRRPLAAEEWELLPDFLALYNLADAVSYVRQRVEGGIPAPQAMAGCHAYARFLAHTSARDWRDRLRAALTSEHPP